MNLSAVRWMYLTCLMLFSAGIARAQEYRQLTINDFQGIPRNTGVGTIAYTNCSIDFRYKAQRERNYYRLNFDIHLTMNTYKSWMDKQRITSPEMLAEVLKHEQGHYFIAFMEQQELLREVSKTVFRADYQAAAMNIFNRIDAKYRQLNLDYDADTQHMQNRTQQQSWDAYFKKRQDFMPQKD